MNDNAIEIRGLEKCYGDFQLGPLDLTVPKGAIYGLIGPNAAGKTTTIDLILGMGKEDAGTIEVFGLDHWDEEVEIKKRLGYVSPDLNYGAWKKVSRLIQYIRQYYGDWDMVYCAKLMEKLGIDPVDRIATMSFGTKVKLSLVMALSHRPELLLLDEPTIGVDAVSKQEIFGELLAAVQDEERTVLISSHGLSDIERFADHIGIINKGRLLLEGPTSEIVERHRMVDFAWANGDRPKNVEGFTIQKQSAGRCRALIDTTTDARDWLTFKGVKEISETPVTLEELFVALVKEGEK
jgi:ABC-2 type transport system ATP-binding protein